MTTFYYTFRSMTKALNAVEKFKSRGLKVTPIRAPEPLRSRGCGYCIPIPEGKFYGLSGVLRAGDYEKLYRFRDGEWKELAL